MADVVRIPSVQECNNRCKKWWVTPIPKFIEQIANQRMSAADLCKVWQEINADKAQSLQKQASKEELMAYWMPFWQIVYAVTGGDILAVKALTLVQECFCVQQR